MLPIIGRERAKTEVPEQQRTELCGELALCAAGEISFNGRTYAPDASTAYALVKLSHTVPVVTAYGECLTPSTVQRSHGTMRHKPVSREHKIKAYDPETISRDHILGSVVDVRFEWRPGSPLPATEAEAPGVEALVALFKASEGMAQMLGQHQSGRHQYTVSMEVRYLGVESGFLVRAPGRAPGSTPTPWHQAGWSYVPALEAPDALLATRDWKRGRMTEVKANGRRYGLWEGAEVYWAMGGLDGEVHYTGIGWVKYGAEPTARVAQMLASGAKASGLPGASLWR